MTTLTREEYMTMRAYIIDPNARMVREVEHDGTPAGLASLYRGDAVKYQVINSGGDAMMYHLLHSHEWGS